MNSKKKFIYSILTLVIIGIAIKQNMIKSYAATVRTVNTVSTLTSAITNSNSGDTIKLSGNISGVEITIPSDKNIILELNGYTLTGIRDSSLSSVKTRNVITNNGTLVINGPGTVQTAEDVGGCNDAYRAIANTGGTLTINSGTIKSLVGYGTKNDQVASLWISTGTVYLNGGEISYEYIDSTHTACYPVYIKGGTLNVNGGDILGKGPRTNTICRDGGTVNLNCGRMSDNPANYSNVNRNYTQIATSSSKWVFHKVNTSITPGKAATCTEYGWKGYYTCTCGKIYQTSTSTTSYANLAAWKTSTPGYIRALSHSFTYSASGSSLTCLCQNDASHTATIAINAISTDSSESDPNIYWTDEHGASFSLENTSQWNNLTNSVPVLTYEGISPTVYSNTSVCPTSPGNYKAMITVGGKSASVVFEIKKVYTISFDSNGGRGSMENIKTIDPDYTLPQNRFIAPLETYFDGWSYSKDGDKIIDSTITLAGNITLHARWLKHFHYYTDITIREGVTKSSCDCGYYIIRYSQ